MSVLAGSFGPGRLAVFPPWVDGSASGIDAKALGLAYWWGRAIHLLGREAASTLITVDDPEHAGWRAMARSARPPTDLEVLSVMNGPLAARFALLTYFQAGEGVGAHLRSARLVEARPGMSLQTLQAWAFEGDAPEQAAFELLRRVATKVGLKVPYGSWAEAFGTGEVAAVRRYLDTLGAFSIADYRCLLGAPEAAMRAMLEALVADPNMPAAIELLPPLLRVLSRQPGVGRGVLVKVLATAREIVGGSPEAWQPLDAELGVLRPV